MSFIGKLLIGRINYITLGIKPKKKKSTCNAGIKEKNELYEFCRYIKVREK